MPFHLLSCIVGIKSSLHQFPLLHFIITTALWGSYDLLKVTNELHSKVGFQTWVSQILVWNVNHYTTLIFLVWLPLNTNKKVTWVSHANHIASCCPMVAVRPGPNESCLESKKGPDTFLCLLLKETKAWRQIILFWLLSNSYQEQQYLKSIGTPCGYIISCMVGLSKSEKILEYDRRCHNRSFRL